MNSIEGENENDNEAAGRERNIETYSYATIPSLLHDKYSFLLKYLN